MNTLKDLEFIFSDQPQKLISSFDNPDVKLIYSLYYDIQFNSQYYMKKIFHRIKNSSDIKDFTIFIWNNFFDSQLILNKENSFEKINNDKPKTLSFYDLFIIDIIISGYTNKIVYIPITNSFVSKNDPVKIYNLTKEIKDLTECQYVFISDDKKWCSIFTETVFYYEKNKKLKISSDHFFWVESDFDLFTYSVFMPGKIFKKAGSSSNIFDILNKNPNHNAIIDRDGFSRKNISYLKNQFNLFFTITSECENIWLTENILQITNKLTDNALNINDFKNKVINKASNNIENTLIRFKNRQDYLMYHYIPYLNENEINAFRKKCENHISQNKYDKILNWFDNKKLFNTYIQLIGFKSLQDWKKFILKNKDHFSKNEIKIII